MTEGEEQRFRFLFIPHFPVEGFEGPVIVTVSEHRFEIFKGIEFKIEMGIGFLECEKIIVPGFRRDNGRMGVQRKPFAHLFN